MDVEVLIGALGTFAAAILAAQWRLMSRMLAHYSHERKLDRASEERLQDQLIGVLRDQAVTLRASMAAIRRKLSAIHLAVGGPAEEEERGNGSLEPGTDPGVSTGRRRV